MDYDPHERRQPEQQDLDEHGRRRSPTPPDSDEFARHSSGSDNVFVAAGLGVKYGAVTAISGVGLTIREHEITAFIGPSGCGKSSVLRCFNRMNDLIKTAEAEGTIHFRGVDIYEPGIDPVVVRRRIGMVSQTPNPFPESIYDNLAYWPRIGETEGDIGQIVEMSLTRVGLTAFFASELDGTQTIFSDPTDARTEAYIAGCES